MKHYLAIALLFFSVALFSMEDKEEDVYSLCVFQSKKNLKSRCFQTTKPSQDMYGRDRCYYRIIKGEPELLVSMKENSQFSSGSAPVVYKKGRCIYEGHLLCYGRISPSGQKKEAFIALFEGNVKKCAIKGKTVASVKQLFSVKEKSKK